MKLLEEGRTAVETRVPGLCLRTVKELKYPEQDLDCDVEDRFNVLTLMCTSMWGCELRKEGRKTVETKLPGLCLRTVKELKHPEQEVDFVM